MPLQPDQERVAGNRVKFEWWFYGFAAMRRTRSQGR
jgi:hypothetical protein